MKQGRKAPNRLITEKSPYLLQHAYNPVEWYPWGEEAFDKAKREDKPIFLSIGYSTCHWCHVMEKESFEDPQVANLMNDTFVCIKVDREERPDIDHVYMAVCQIMTGSGGWPLTIIMTPEKKPFFAATYIPKSTRFGRVGMLELVPRIKKIWKLRRREVVESTQKIMHALKSMEASPQGEQLSGAAIEKAYKSLVARYDKEYGGFSSAPKFPTPHNLTFLLRYWNRNSEALALDMVTNTLKKMRQGGIYDQIGFGFHRYSTDREWVVPHFEKMLYDQALTSIAYLEAFQATGEDFFAQAAKEIFTYVLRDMVSPLGGFFSAEDADSEGEEGKFYLWSKQEILDALDRPEAELICKVYGVKEEGNFKDEATGKKTGKNILYLSKSLSELSVELGLELDELRVKLDRAGRSLFEVRGKRVRPGLDDKVLTDWNGLMIAALAKGGQVLREPRYTEAAEAAADFIMKYLTDPKGGLLHRYRDGEASIEGKLDDYVFLTWGLIELYTATFDEKYLSEAVKLNEMAIRLFWDDVSGGLFFTPNDGEQLILKKKEVYDGAVPSGNSIALLNFMRIARLTGDHNLEKMAEGLIRAFSGEIQHMPSAYTQFLCSFDFIIGPSYELIIAGRRTEKDTQHMIEVVQTGFFPNLVILLCPLDGPKAHIRRVAEFISNYDIRGETATAYLCEGFSCKMPITDPDKLLHALRSPE